MLTSTAQIRWLIRRDMPEVLDIDRRVSPSNDRWCEEDWLCRLRQRNCIGMVAEVDYRIVGVMCYELHRAELKLLRILVHPEDQRCGHGRALIDRMKEKLQQQRRHKLSMIVREDNLPAQLFLKACGFSCELCHSELFDDWTAGYEFVFDVEDAPRVEPSIPLPVSQDERPQSAYRLFRCNCGWSGKRKAWYEKPCPCCGGRVVEY